MFVLAQRLYNAMPAKALYYNLNPFRVYEMTLFYQDTPVLNPYREYYGTSSLLPVNAGAHTGLVEERAPTRSLASRTGLGSTVGFTGLIIFGRTVSIGRQTCMFVGKTKAFATESCLKNSRGGTVPRRTCMKDAASLQFI